MEMRRPNGRRISFGPMRARCECAKTKPLYPGKCWVFIEASGAPPPVAPRDRLSSASHGSRIAAIARTAPGTCLLPQKRAGEGMDRECRNKPTSRQRREVVPRPCQGPQGARSDEWKVQEQTHSAHSRKIAKSDETKPKRSGECWGSGTSMVLTAGRAARPLSLPVTVPHRSHRENRAWHLLSQKRAGEGMESRMQKQTHFSATPEVVPRVGKDRGHAATNGKCRNKPTRRIRVRLPKVTKRSQKGPANAGVREHRWCSTAGRAARPASSASHGFRIAAIARTAPGTFSRRKEEKG